MKLHRHTSQENDEMTTNTWPQFVADDVEHDDIYVMNEFICICCRYSLSQNKKKQQKCLTRHVQMVYNYMISHRIYRTYYHWRELISPKIPFITILVMRQYGGHYKVNGPPVIVPVTLDQIIEILPCMPSELQLHPVKLKHKLEYKSHYMYDMICRDCVISAITWLKEHNSHCADRKLNEHWYNDISAKELSVQIDENNNHITVTDNAVLDQTLQKEITSKDKLNKEDNQQLFTKQIESTHEKTMNTGSDDEDTVTVTKR